MSSNRGCSTQKTAGYLGFASKRVCEPAIAVRIGAAKRCDRTVDLPLDGRPCVPIMFSWLARTVSATTRSWSSASPVAVVRESGATGSPCWPNASEPTRYCLMSSMRSRRRVHAPMSAIPTGAARHTCQTSPSLGRPTCRRADQGDQQGKGFDTFDKPLDHNWSRMLGVLGIWHGLVG